MQARDFALEIAGVSRTGLRRQEVRFPFDRELVVGTFPEAGPEDVEAAIAAAAAGFPRLRATPAHARAAVLARASEQISRRRDELAETICLEAAKPISFARAEADRAASTFSFAAEEARRMDGETLRLESAPAGTGRLGITLRFPRGPVAAITPFNFPLNLAAHKIAPAIAAGAPVVHKPALETPLSAFLLQEILRDAGADPGWLSVVPCANDAAAALVEDPRLPVLSFTGSAAAGWALKQRAARKQVILELGGNAAVVLEPDADWRAALGRLVAGAFAYAGQVCIKAQRILAHSSIAEELTASLVEATRKDARAGDPRQEGVMLGPLIRTRDADRVMAWIGEATSGGGRALIGGERTGDLVTAALLADVPSEASVARQEIFGPVALVEPYATFDDALRLVNDSEYGLQAGVYTNDVKKVLRAFRELEVGAVIHDDVPVFRVDQMPYGGVKASGFGREGLRYAIEEYTEPRLLVLRS